MNIAMLANAAGTQAARLLAWGARRLDERSTIVGIAGIVATLGYSTLGANLTSHADLIMMAAGGLSTALAAASTKPRVIVPPVPAAPPATPTPSISEMFGVTMIGAPPFPPAPSPPATKETDMSLLKVARKVLGIIAVAVAPTWSKAIANGLAQAEATLVPILGDDAKKLCEDAASTTLTGFQKLASVVSDLAKIAADKGIKADAMVLTVIAAKAYAQVAANAPELIDDAIETGITVAAGGTVAALTAPIVEAGVAAATASIAAPAAAAA